MSVGGADVRQVLAPGRVNLLGDHTDYTGGLAVPMAIGRGIRITGKVGARTSWSVPTGKPGANRFADASRVGGARRGAVQGVGVRSQQATKSPRRATALPQLD
jgi:hypothetical protein